MEEPPEPWNHNLHYHPVILAAVPPGCQRALDVGCGNGALTRQLHQVVPEVTGLDRDRPCIERARAHPGTAGIGYLVGDLTAAPLRPASFDLVTSVASLHHMAAGPALRRMRDLLRPGGVLAIVGLARSGPADLPLDLAAVLGHRYHLLVKTFGRTAARRSAGPPPPPVVWPPPETYRGMRRLAAGVLPGARYRRHLLWRYSLVWAKPR